MIVEGQSDMLLCPLPLTITLHQCPYLSNLPSSSGQGTIDPFESEVARDFVPPHSYHYHIYNNVNSLLVLET